MMNQFIAFVRKEFRHIFRDRITTSILLLLPILMLLLFGYAITTEVKNTNLAVYDPSNDAATRRITEQLQAGSYFTLVERLESPGQIESQFKQGRVSLAIVFCSDFEARLKNKGEAQIELIADGTDPNTARTIVQYASAIIGSSVPSFQGQDPQGMPVDVLVRMLYNPGMKSAYNYVPGVMGMILMLICAMMSSISIAREKEQGTMDLLLVSPMNPLLLIIAKTLPYFFLSLVNLTTILLLSVFLLDVPIAGSLLTLILFSLLYLFVNLALGLLISSVANSQLVALLISGMVLMIPVIMLSGMLFPVENMPGFFRWLSHILPAKWYITGVRRIMIMGLDFRSVWLEFTVLFSMAILLIGASLQSFNKRLT